MELIADRLAEKIHTITGAQLAEVERFVESLEVWEQDREMARVMARVSEPSFAAIWSNPEDEVYDDL